MRHVVIYSLLSLDGVAEHPDRWLFDVDEELRAHLADVIGRQDAVLLGRRTHDEWVDHWPAHGETPFGRFINAVPKHVVTSTPPPGTWAHRQVVRGPVLEHVADLRAGEGGDIGVHGSITLARSLLAADLVDELRLVVAPTLARAGRRLFEEGPPLRRTTLLEATPTSTGALLLGYRVESAPPARR